MIPGLISGLGRQTLVASPAGTITGSTGLGVFDVQKYSRFTGMVSAVGSVTLRFSMQIQSGTTITTTQVVINSGSGIFEQLNYGRECDFHISAANSQSSFALIIMGEPL